MREGTILLPFAGVLPREINENSFFQIKNIGIKKTFIDPDKKRLIALKTRYIFSLRNNTKRFHFFLSFDFLSNVFDPLFSCSPEMLYLCLCRTLVGQVRVR